MPPAAVEPVSSLSSASGAPATPAAPATVPATTTPAPAANVPAQATPAATATPAVAATPAAPAAPAIPETKRFADPNAPAAEAKPADPAAKPDEWTLTAPKDVQIPEPVLRAAESFAKEHKLGKELAEKILARDLAADTARQTAAKAEADTIGNTWHEATMAHPEIGGTNAKASEAAVNKAMMAFATADERKLIYDSPFINNPIFRAIMNRAAKAIPVEDGLPPVSGRAPAPVQSPQERIYGRK